MIESLEIFRYRNQFYDLCAAHQVFAWNIHPADVGPKDTILISPPAQPCRPEYKELPSPELQANLKCAESIFQYVQRKVPHCPNYGSRTGDLSPMGIPLDPEFSALDLLSEDYSLLEVVEKIERNKSGCCEAMTYVGMIYAWKTYPDIMVEAGSIGRGRHTFLIIGREQTSNFRNYRTWGKNCVLCDPWAGKYYPFSKLENELYDFQTVLLSRGPGHRITYPYVRPFDPQTQCILLHFAEPFSEEERHWILSGKKPPVSEDEDEQPDLPSLINFICSYVDV